MLVPGAEFPHLCAQCEDYPCVQACPFKALGVHPKTGAVAVEEAKCVGCGKCIDACPGRIPHIHPQTKKILICDLCGGNPKCANACEEGGWNCLQTSKNKVPNRKANAKTPEESTKKLATKMYGKKAEEFF
jgi:Fe-S-cluster-containing dehydrogenase component